MSLESLLIRVELVRRNRTDWDFSMCLRTFLVCFIIASHMLHDDVTIKQIKMSPNIETSQCDCTNTWTGFLKCEITFLIDTWINFEPV